MLSHVRLFTTPWTVACQAPLSVEFSRPKYWNRWPFPSPGDLANPGIEPKFPTLQADSLPSEPPEIYINNINEFSDLNRLVFRAAVQSLSPVQLFATQWTAAPKFPCPTLSPGFCSNSCPLGGWCLPTISSSVNPFSSCLQSCSAWGSFPKSWLFPSGSQSIRASASASDLQVYIKGWFPLGLTDLTSLQSKKLLRVFSSTTV